MEYTGYASRFRPLGDEKQMIIRSSLGQCLYLCRVYKKKNIHDVPLGRIPVQYAHHTDD